MKKPPFVRSTLDARRRTLKPTLKSLVCCSACQRAAEQQKTYRTFLMRVLASGVFY